MTLDDTNYKEREPEDHPPLTRADDGYEGRSARVGTCVTIPASIHNYSPENGFPFCLIFASFVFRKFNRAGRIKAMPAKFAVFGNFVENPKDLSGQFLIAFRPVIPNPHRRTRRSPMALEKNLPYRVVSWSSTFFLLVTEKQKKWKSCRRQRSLKGSRRRI